MTLPISCIAFSRLVSHTRSLSRERLFWTTERVIFNFVFLRLRHTHDLARMWRCAFVDLRLNSTVVPGVFRYFSPALVQRWGTTQPVNGVLLQSGARRCSDLFYLRSWRADDKIVLHHAFNDMFQAGSFISGIGVYHRNLASSNGPRPAVAPLSSGGLSLVGHILSVAARRIALCEPHSCCNLKPPPSIPPPYLPGRRRAKPLPSVVIIAA